ncbi:hypothetical protein GC170_17790 [bacterium]|nr:hypothetical protein [bacterium]
MNWPGYRPKTRRFRYLAEGRPAVDAGRSSVRPGAIRRGAGASLLVLTQAFSAWSAEKPAGNLFYHPSAGFQIPFEIDPADKPFVKSIELYVSSDLGKSWRLNTATNPNSKAFKFRATGDGEYWFAVRTLDVEGHYNPADDKPIVPGWRVIVDSKKPGLGLRSIARRGTMATIAWDARDEYLDMGTFVLEYSIPGSGEWKPVPIARPAPNGESTWDCGTAEAVRVRATVADKAGNVQIAETQFGDGAAQHPNLNASRSSDMEGQAPPPIARVASAAGDRRGILGPQDPLANRSQRPEEEWIDTPRPYGPESMTPATRGSESGRMPRQMQPPDGQYGAAGTREPTQRRQIPILNSPKFPMNYVVDDAGPNGPASVELWVTRDGGRNWSRWAEDDDRVSPMMVDLGGEGVFGLSIVARSIAGQGDEIPRSGTVPQISVEIDATPPAMILNVIKVGVGSQSGKVLISWQAEDRNFSSRPISIYYRPETANQWLPIVENIENTGQYVWTPGPQVPPVFHVRIEARDLAGNRSTVDTTQYEPVLLDRSRPKGRILGINVAPIDTSNLNGSSNPPAAPSASEPVQATPSARATDPPPARVNPEPVGAKPSGRIEPFPPNAEPPATKGGENFAPPESLPPTATDPIVPPAQAANSATETPESAVPPKVEAAPIDKPSAPPQESTSKPPANPDESKSAQPAGLHSIPPSASATPAIAPPPGNFLSSLPGSTEPPAIAPPGGGKDANSPDAGGKSPGVKEASNQTSTQDLKAPPAPLPPSSASDPNADILPLSLELPDSE